MTSRVVNLSYIASDQSDIVLITNYLDDKPGATFDDIRNDIQQLAGMDNPSMRVLCIDAGFHVPVDV